jgi:membrane protease YdiL (CAAX protease family)
MSFNPQSAIRNPHSDERAVAAWEIVSVVSSVVVAEWVVLAVAGDSQLLLSVPVAVVLAFMSVSHRLRGESARELGWRLDNFGAAARLLLILFGPPAALLLLVGWLTGSLGLLRWGGGQSILGAPALGVLWGLLQQYALQGFINRRAQAVWGRGWKSILVVAVVFGALHLPNPSLTLATFAGGLLWAYAYQRVPNLLALGLSHGLMTWALIASVPPDWLNNLRVGFKYFG